MRTVVVLNHFAQPLSSPGGTRHVELFSKLTGWQARVIAADRNLLDGSPVRAGGVLETVRVTPYSGNGAARVVSWCSFALTGSFRALRAPRIDVVYGSSPHLLAALTGWMAARVRRVPFVLEVRDVWPKVLLDMGALTESSVIYRLLSRLERFLYRRSDQIVILAEGVRPYLLGHGVADERIVFVPNGADAGDFRPSVDRVELRLRYAFEGIVAIYAGAHGPANGLDLLLDAARQLKTTCPELRIVLIGDGALKPNLMKRAEQEQLDNVTFMNPVPKSEVRDVMSAADIGVHCLADVELFRTAVSPNKLYDYMAAGLPVITNTPGEVSDFVNQSGGGEAVAPHGLADGLRAVYSIDDERRRELGASGRDYLAHTRSRRDMAERIETMLESLVPRPMSQAESRAG